jgi:ribose-phosphate pyrophosphokinase
MTVDALRRMGVKEIELECLYFPGARQDRVCSPGEALSVKVYADMINAMEFSCVSILDPHSEVTPALINNCYEISNLYLVRYAIGKANDFVLVSPDAGANKKIKSLASSLSFYHDLDVVNCDKTRDVATGNLTGFEVYADDLNGKDCYVVDDICDGGGTFIGLAEELKAKGAGDLYLIVSHGIFSKGFKELRKHFKKIYTSNSWVDSYSMEIPEIEKGSEITTIINI